MNRLPFDLATLGQAWGWKQSHSANVPAVTAALLAGEPVAVIQEVGKRTWLGPIAARPKSLKLFARWPEYLNNPSAVPLLDGTPSSSAPFAAALSHLCGLIVISDRALPPLPAELVDHTIAFRPPTLALGLSCFRGVRFNELENIVALFFARAGLAEESLMAMATPASRKHEPALLDFVEQRALPLFAYPADKLAILRAKGTPVRKMAGLCEAAARLAAGGAKVLAAPKQVFARLALAAARRVG